MNLGSGEGESCTECAVIKWLMCAMIQCKLCGIKLSSFIILHVAMHAQINWVF